MIWHLVEVWLMVVLAFVVGCLGGAHLYGLVAGSRLGFAQGILADAVGDILDRVKARIGLAPAWRPAHLRQVERAWRPDPAPAPQPEPGDAVESAPPPVDDAAPAEDWDADIVPVSVAVAVPAVRGPSGRLPGRDRDRQPVGIQPLSGPRSLPSPIAPMRPAGVAAPRGGVPDNLQRIKGIGKRNEELLNGLGIFHFGQIAAWTPGESLWIGKYLAFPERIFRDDWVGQATLLAMGSETGFQKSAERRRDRRRREREFQARMVAASEPIDDADENGSALPSPDGADQAPALAESGGDAIAPEVFPPVDDDESFASPPVDRDTDTR